MPGITKGNTQKQAVSKGKKYDSAPTHCGASKTTYHYGSQAQAPSNSLQSGQGKLKTGNAPAAPTQRPIRFRTWTLDQCNKNQKTMIPGIQTSA